MLPCFTLLASCMKSHFLCSTPTMSALGQALAPRSPVSFPVSNLHQACWGAASSFLWERAPWALSKHWEPLGCFAWLLSVCIPTKRGETTDEGFYNSLKPDCSRELEPADALDKGWDEAHPSPALVGLGRRDGTPTKLKSQLG